MQRPSKNVSAFIALQVVPTLLWGGTGVGKTSVLLALGRYLERVTHLLIGSTHLPEDFSGYPDADRAAGVMRMMPTSWVDKFKGGDGYLVLDEITTVQHTTQAGLLSIITEKQVGEYRLPDTTLIVAAANPPELAPNGSALPPSMRSRFYHHKWEVDREELYAGFRAGLNWGTPPFPKVPDDHVQLYPKYGSLVEAFLRGNPDCLEKIPDSDEVLSFPNPRTWSYVVKCLSAAEAVGFAPGSSVFRQLVTGCVGDAAAAEFLAFLDKLDLVDPAAVLDGSATFTHNSSRPDLSLCLLTGIVRELQRETSKARWERAAEVFCDVGESDVEVFLTQFNSLWKPVASGGVRPDGYMPAAALCKRLVGLVPQGITA